MEAFLSDNWQWVIGALGVVASYLIPGLRNIWVIVFQALVTEAALIRAFIYFGDKIVDSTSNRLDNILWDPVKKALIDKLK